MDASRERIHLARSNWVNPADAARMRAIAAFLAAIAGA
jgi:hypothetical protein